MTRALLTYAAFIAGAWVVVIGAAVLLWHWPLETLITLAVVGVLAYGNRRLA